MTKVHFKEVCPLQRVIQLGKRIKWWIGVARADEIGSLCVIDANCVWVVVNSDARYGCCMGGVLVYMVGLGNIIAYAGARLIVLPTSPSP